MLAAASCSGLLLPAVQALTEDADATVARDGMVVPGDSIMGLLMLGAAKGTQIEVRTTGAQAEALGDALKTLVEGRFGADC